MHGRFAVPAGALRALKVGTVTLVVAGLVLAAVLVAWPHLFSSESTRLRPDPGGSWIGEAEGWVRSAEPSTSTIRVSSGFLGLSSFALVVTPDTLITVGGKEGGFDDMYEGRWVRAAYEERPDGFRATSIEVVVDGARAERRQPIGRPAPPENLSTSTGGGPAAAGPRPDASTNGPVGDSPGEHARKPMTPSPSTRRSVAAGEPPPDNQRSSPSSDIRSDGGSQAREAEPRQTQETDPAAVIDWLLKRSPPRSP